MKKYILLVFLLCQGIITLFAQAPVIEWQKTYGGIGIENQESMIKTTDGGQVIFGINFNVSSDFVVTKINNVGNIEWQKSLGGSQWESNPNVFQTNDGSFVLFGNSNSNDGDVSGHHDYADIWVVKLGNTGTILWEKSLGGNSIEFYPRMLQGNDGDFVLVCESLSNDGDVSGHHGNSDKTDIWIAKINSVNGYVLWQKSLGGSNAETFPNIYQSFENEFYIICESKSNDGDVSGNHGNKDICIFKVSNAGILIWQKSFGGSESDGILSNDVQFPIPIFQLSDGNLIFASNSTSIDGDLIGNQSQSWVVKFSQSGNIIWKNTYGNSDELLKKLIKTTDNELAFFGEKFNNGSLNNFIFKVSNNNGSIIWEKSIGGSDTDLVDNLISTSDGAVLMIGRTRSSNGDMVGNHGEMDVYVVKIANNGNLLWTKIIGGTGDEFPTSVFETTEGKYLISGTTNSNNGDFAGNTSQYAAFLIKLSVVPFSISPSNQLVICQTSVALTAVGCPGTVKWYRDTNGSGTTNIFLGTSNPLSYLINSDLTQFVRATCTVGLTTSNYSNYAILRNGPVVTPVSYIIKAGASKILTASGCPAGTTYLWETGETTASVSKSPTTPPSQYPTTYNVKCVSPTCQSSNGFGYIYVGAIEANDDTYVLNIETPFSGNFCTNDAPLASKFIQIESYPTHGTLTFNNTGAFTYSPNAGYTGTDTFTYFFSDGNIQFSNMALVTLTVVCPTSVMLSSTNTPTDDISTGTIIKQANAATGTITATNKITGAGTRATYQAKSIILNAGFKADNGTVFKAEVGGCN